MANEQIQVRGEEQPQEIRERPAVAPPIDIYENPDEYLLVADLPGVEPGDIEVQYDRGRLTLHAPRRTVHVEGSLSREFAEVDFRRSFRVPEKVDSENITAQLEHGVLHLRLPKSPEFRPRKIEVKAA